MLEMDFKDAVRHLQKLGRRSWASETLPDWLGSMWVLANRATSLGPGLKFIGFTSTAEASCTVVACRKKPPLRTLIHLRKSLPAGIVAGRPAGPPTRLTTGFGNAQSVGKPQHPSLSCFQALVCRNKDGSQVRSEVLKQLHQLLC